MFYLRAAFAACVGLFAWTVLVLLGVMLGWWRVPIAPPDDPSAFLDAVTDLVETRNRGSFAMALVEDGEVYDEVVASTGEAVDRDTTFETASVVKWITAWAVMTLVEDGRLDLGRPVATYLGRSLPSGFDTDDVTARRLLSHTAGNATGAFGYSDEGYLLLRQLVEAVTGIPFEDYLQASILDPLGMSGSTSGANGFVSSTRDLARFVQAQLPNRALARPLRQATVDRMREPQVSLYGIAVWGLGTMLYAPTPSGDYVFGHDGSNEPAANAAVRVNPDTADGLVVLASGSAPLASEVGFHWVLWQTGRPDAISLGSELERAVPLLVAGWVVVSVLAAAIAWTIRVAV